MLRHSNGHAKPTPRMAAPLMLMVMMPSRPTIVVVPELSWFFRRFATGLDKLMLDEFVVDKIVAVKLASRTDAFSDRGIDMDVTGTNFSGRTEIAPMLGCSLPASRTASTELTN